MCVSPHLSSSVQISRECLDMEIMVLYQIRLENFHGLSVNPGWFPVLIEHISHPFRTGQGMNGPTHKLQSCRKSTR